MWGHKASLRPMWKVENFPKEKGDPPLTIGQRDQITNSYSRSNSVATIDKDIIFDREIKAEIENIQPPKIIKCK
jgi:hypothetical protein